MSQRRKKRPQKPEPVRGRGLNPALPTGVSRNLRGSSGVPRAWGTWTCRHILPQYREARDSLADFQTVIIILIILRKLSPAPHPVEIRKIHQICDHASSPTPLTPLPATPNPPPPKASNPQYLDPMGEKYQRKRRKIRIQNKQRS